MKEFNEIYQEIYEKTYPLLKQKRLEVAKRTEIILGIFFIIGIILCIIYKNILYIFSFISIGIICSIVLTAKMRNEYKRIFKEEVIGVFVKQYSDKLDYKYNKGVSSLVYSQAEFEKFDIFHSEDYIYGNLEDGYKLEMSEIHTEYEEIDSEGNIEKGTIFRGLFAKVEFDKVIEDTIKVRRNTLKLFNNKKRMEMDSGEFEQIYDIYSNGKIVTMQLFTAEIMGKFIDFRNKNKMTPELTLKKNKLYIRFKTGNVFETNLFNRPLNYNILKKYYNIIQFTLEITEMMLKNIKETEI